MSALQYVDVPGYAAILFRKTLTDLKQPGALLDRSMSWLVGTDAKWEGSTHTWVFPTYDHEGNPSVPSKITFGYIGESQAHLRYQGIEVQQICFDETTQHQEEDYRYLFSRLRKLVCPIHQAINGVPNYLDDCPICQQQKNLPLKMRGATNPGGPGGCVREGDVLTPDRGWIPIQQMRVGDRVYTVCRNTGLLKTALVDQTHAYQFSGNLKRICSRGLWMEFTPNHRLVYSKETGALDLRTFDQLPGQARLLRSPRDWKGLSPFYFNLPEDGTRKPRSIQPLKLKFRDYCELMGWFLSEGHTQKKNREFGISQVKPHNRDKIRSLLVRCGFRFTENVKGFLVYSRRWWSYLSQFGKCEQKFIPRSILNSDKEHLQIFLDALMDGDGHWVTKEGGLQESGEYYTTSDNLRDGVLEVCLKLGLCAYTKTRNRIGNKTKNGIARLLSHVVSFKRVDGNWSEVLTGNHIYKVATEMKRRTDVEDVPYEGPVYCIGVEGTHTFILRQNGCVWVSGNSWVKRRFKIGPHIDLRKAALAGEKVRYIGHDPKRPFIPSFAADNPHLDLESYASALDELDPTTREQLKEGRWDVSPDSRFKRHWAKYYSKRGEYFCLGTEGTGPQHHADSLTRIFCTVDPASSSKHGPGDILTWKKEPSYTVISVWGLTRDYHLLWLDMVRFRREIPDVIMAMKTVNRHWRPDAFYVEANGLGQGVYQGATREGLPVQPVHTRVDKVVNASEAMIRMSQGRIWFPEVASWLSTAEDEVFFWTGDPIRTDDIVDSLSNAARQIAWDDPVVIPDNPETGTFEYSTNDLPTIIYDQEANGVDSPFGNY